MTGKRMQSAANLRRSADRPPRVLLVDDEPFNLDLLEQELTEEDLEVVTATDGTQALQIIAASPPDMIFLDLMMPGVDGFSVLEQLQANDAWRAIPVVIVSAASDLANVVRGIKMGAVDFLPKPFEPAILQARLAAGLEKKRLRDLELQYFQSLERELEIGREIQAGFLPTSLPQPQGWLVQAHFQAAHEVAGDFYDAFEVAPGKLGLLLGDVTDKGVGSALFMALYRSLLRVTLLSDTFPEDLDAPSCTEPEGCLLHGVRLVNRYISRFHENAMFATLFFGILDTDSGSLCYVNAGHDPAYVIHGDEIRTSIQPTGPMVGVIPEAEYEVRNLELAPGECLVLYSDGVPDAQDAGGAMFGAERFRALLTEPGFSPQARFTALLEALDRHLEGAAQYDDITLLMVSRDG
jgi:sigma-B regulation protein RsbU (phosphoserine phosphatase)